VEPQLWQCEQISASFLGLSGEFPGMSQVDLRLADLDIHLGESDGEHFQTQISDVSAAGAAEANGGHHQLVADPSD
jgi:hypothetical protein